MASILANYTDVFVQNGLVEAGAGLVAFALPDLFFPNSKPFPHATFIARWWASAVIGLGISSLLVSTCTSPI